MPSATLDTSTYISALQYGGEAFSLLEMGRDGEIDLAVSEEIIAETLGVLKRKFGWSDARLEGARATMEATARSVVPQQTLNVIIEDPPDNRILECAVEAGSEYIVSGDRDFLRRGSYEGIRMVKVADFLNIVTG
ncbi:MAG TPA: putative toxin-antitoxin system toxin component, PIN family [Terriglobia bacterium]